MPSPILARADALMHRRRQNGGDGDDVPVLTDLIEDDIPVLSDLDAAISALPPLNTPPAITEPEPPVVIAPAEPIASPTPASTPLPDSLLNEQLARELARRVEQRIAAELPRIVESTLRDFLAEQAMIASATPRD